MRDIEMLYDVVEELVAIAEARGVTAAQVALAWTLQRPGVASVVVGARTDAQLAANLKAHELTLDTPDMERLEKASRPPLIYPYWHQRSTASDRLSAADKVLIGNYG